MIRLLFIYVLIQPSIHRLHARSLFIHSLICQVILGKSLPRSGEITSCMQLSGLP